MRLVNVPDFGPRLALQPTDLTKFGPFFTTLEREWQLGIAAAQFPGSCTGHFALCPAITVHTVAARAGTKVQTSAIMVPGICYGSDLWMGQVGELIERLKQRGIHAFYDQSTVSDVDLATLQVKGAAELQLLRTKLAAHPRDVTCTAPHNH